MNKNIIFFDGVCGLCHGLVDFVLKVDKKGIFLFSPLQSEEAIKHLPVADIEDLNLIVVVIDGKIYRKSEAVAKIFGQLGGPWSLLGQLKFIPSFWLDRGYDLVASHRYKLFGKKDSCRLPTPEERARFL